MEVPKLAVEKYILENVGAQLIQLVLRLTAFSLCSYLISVNFSKQA